MPQFDEVLTITDGQRNGFKIVMDPNKRGIQIFRAGSSDPVVRLDGQRAELHIGGGDAGGDLYLYRSDGARTLFMDAQDGNLYLGGQGADGDLMIRNSDNQRTIQLNGNGAQGRFGDNGLAGQIRLQAESGDTSIRLEGEHGNLTLGHGSATTEGVDGDLFVRNKFGTDTVRINGDTSEITLRADSGDTSIRLEGEHGNLTLGYGSPTTQGVDGDLFVRNRFGVDTVHINGDTGDIILQQADCAEDFDLADPSVEPGAVVVIENEGRLRVSEQAYDKRVAGVISGAGGYRPGLVLDRQEGLDNRATVALVGKVFCKVDATFGEVSEGDLLTTSPNTGYAMRVDDPLRAFGAVIGKALRPLMEGTALIPILITLQ